MSSAGPIIRGIIPDRGQRAPSHDDAPPVPSARPEPVSSARPLRSQTHHDALSVNAVPPVPSAPTHHVALSASPVPSAPPETSAPLPPSDSLAQARYAELDELLSLDDLYKRIDLHKFSEGWSLGGDVGDECEFFGKEFSSIESLIRAMGRFNSGTYKYSKETFKYYRKMLVAKMSDSMPVRYRGETIPGKAALAALVFERMTVMKGLSARICPNVSSEASVMALGGSYQYEKLPSQWIVNPKPGSLTKAIIQFQERCHDIQTHMFHAKVIQGEPDHQDGFQILKLLHRVYPGYSCSTVKEWQETFDYIIPELKVVLGDHLEADDINQFIFEAARELMFLWAQGCDAHVKREAIAQYKASFEKELNAESAMAAISRQIHAVEIPIVSYT